MFIPYPQGFRALSLLPQRRAINPFQKAGFYVSSFQKLCKVYFSPNKIELRFLLTVCDYLKGSPYDYLTGTFSVSFFPPWLS